MCLGIECVVGGLLVFRDIDFFRFWDNEVRVWGGLKFLGIVIFSYDYFYLFILVCRINSIF